MKKCPVCGFETRNDDLFCIECGLPFFEHDKKGRALLEYLLKNNMISSPEDIEKTVEFEVEIGSDDGLLRTRQIEGNLVCPLYYTEKDVLEAALRAKMISKTDFHYIMNFVSYEYRSSAEKKDFPRKKSCGEYVLAEAAELLASKKLHITYARRAEMVSRAGPNVCLYGCPASSEIEKKFFDTTYKTELIDLE